MQTTTFEARSLNLFQKRVNTWLLQLAVDGSDALMLAIHRQAFFDHDRPPPQSNKTQ